MTFDELVFCYGGTNASPDTSIQRFSEQDLQTIVEETLRRLYEKYRDRQWRPRYQEPGNPQHPTLAQICGGVGTFFWCEKGYRRRILKLLKRLAMRGRVARTHHEPSRWRPSNVIEAIAAI